MSKNADEDRDFGSDLDDDDVLGETPVTNEAEAQNKSATTTATTAQDDGHTGLTSDEESDDDSDKDTGKSAAAIEESKKDDKDATASTPGADLGLGLSSDSDSDSDHAGKEKAKFVPSVAKRPTSTFPTSDAVGQNESVSSDGDGGDGPMCVTHVSNSITNTHNRSLRHASFF